MGASDGILFPLYTAYIKKHFEENLKSVKKIAWLGSQRNYYVSDEVSRLKPGIEQHFFDIVPQGDPNFCHKFDLNDTGFGLKFNQENFDLLTVLRCSCYIEDHESCIKEFKDFLGRSQEKFIIFEDLDPNLSYGPEIAFYHGVRTEKTKRPFTQAVLRNHFNITDTQVLIGPDGKWYEVCILSLKT